MIIFSQTISLDKGIENDWLAWMQDVHIPQVMATKFFESHKVLKLLDPIVDDQMVTYSVQYHCLSVAIYRKFERKHAKKFHDAHQERYGNRFVSFKTLLEQV